MHGIDTDTTCVAQTENVAWYVQARHDVAEAVVQLTSSYHGP